MTTNNDRYRCDKCNATWTGNATGICPRCGVGIDIGNLVIPARRSSRGGEDA